MSTGIAGLVMIVSCGLLIGFEATRVDPWPMPPQALATESNNPSVAAAPVRTNPLPRLTNVAVVDMNKLLAAHPWTTNFAVFLTDLRAEANTTSDPQQRHLKEITINERERRMRDLVCKDIQSIIADYSASQGLTAVIDRTARLKGVVPFPIYPSDTVSLRDIIRAPGIRDITIPILGEIEKGRPEPGSKTTARR